MSGFDRFALLGFTKHRKYRKGQKNMGHLITGTSLQDKEQGVSTDYYYGNRSKVILKGGRY